MKKYITIVATLFISISCTNKQNKVQNIEQSSPQIQQANLKNDNTSEIGLAKYIDFKMPNNGGTNISLSDFVGKNKLVLVDFWASWCGPCRKDMPNIVSIYKAFHNKGLEIVGVSLDENDEDWKNAIRDLSMSWPQMSDLKGWQSSGARLYNIQAIPSSILINAKGEIVARDLHGKELYDTIESYLTL